MMRSDIAKVNIITVVPPKEISFQVVLETTNSGNARHYFITAESAHEARYMVSHMASEVEGRIVPHYELIIKLLQNNSE
jgi:hypothetical protein